MRTFAFLAFLAFIGLPPASAAQPPALPVPQPAPVPPAEMGYPQGIVVDGQGNLLVSDPTAAAVFSISPKKEIKLFAQWSPELKKTTVGPWIYCNFQGLLLEPDGTVVSPDPSARSLWRLHPDGKIDHIVQDFNLFDTPQGICSDGAGNYVIADPKMHGILKATKEGKVSALVVSDTTTLKPLRNPRGIVRDKDGSYVVADGSLKGVFRVSADGKTVTPIASGKPFSFPQGITQDTDGSFLVPDNYARAIFRVTDGKVQPLLSGDPLRNPRNIALDGQGGYYVTDPGIPAILHLSHEGKAEVWLPIKPRTAH